MRANSTLVTVAAVTTAVVSTGLFAAEQLSVYEPVRMAVFRTTGRGLYSDPFGGLYLYAGVSGGILAGYLTEGRWQSGLINGVKSGVLAVLFLYLLLTLPNIALSVWEGGPVAVYAILVVPLIFVFPVALLFPLEGGAAGAIATWLRNA